MLLACFEEVNLSCTLNHTFVNTHCLGHVARTWTRTCSRYVIKPCPRKRSSRYLYYVHLDLKITWNDRAKRWIVVFENEASVVVSGLKDQRIPTCLTTYVAISSTLWSRHCNLSVRCVSCNGNYGPDLGAFHDSPSLIRAFLSIQHVESRIPEPVVLTVAGFAGHSGHSDIGWDQVAVYGNSRLIFLCFRSDSRGGR